jgi:hypothetical protein
MSNTPKKVFALRRSFRSAFALPELPVLERGPLSDEYLDAVQKDIDAKLGPASDRKPVTRSGW